MRILRIGFQCICLGSLFYITPLCHQSSQIGPSDGGCHQGDERDRGSNVAYCIEEAPTLVGGGDLCLRHPHAERQRPITWDTEG